MRKPVRIPEPVSASPWRPQLAALVVTGALATGLVGGLLLNLFWPRGYLGPYEYRLWRYEAENALHSAFALAGFGREPSEPESARVLQDYFRLTSALRAAEESASPDFALLEALSTERALYENDVERILERRISRVAAASGLQRALPLFRQVRITWPPVDFELTSPPRLLVRSPRDEIRRLGDTLLRADLELKEVERIEAATDRADLVSLVIAVGGLAAYPAIVRDDRSYDSLLETAAHEWIHHYLAFYPLGQAWGSGGDAEALNETVADLAGGELARLVRTVYPVQLADGEDGRRPAGPPPTVDFTAEMRALRIEVDRLLAEGRVTEAETLMETKRLFLAANGIQIRKINQAYFAFYGTYAESPASTNPIGPKVRQAWERTGTLGSFLTVMREVESVADLDRALETLGAPAGGP